MEGTPHHATYNIHVHFHRYAKITVNHFNDSQRVIQSHYCYQSQLYIQCAQSGCMSLCKSGMVCLVKLYQNSVCITLQLRGLLAIVYLYFLVTTIIPTCIVRHCIRQVFFKLCITNLTILVTITFATHGFEEVFSKQTM